MSCILRLVAAWLGCLAGGSLSICPLVWVGGQGRWCTDHPNRLRWLKKAPCPPPLGRWRMQ